jgi:hypothetical protein
MVGLNKLEWIPLDRLSVKVQDLKQSQEMP